MIREKAEHIAVMFRSCRRILPDRIGCGGRVFWGPAEPRWEQALGFVGICCLCGAQWFTQDLIRRPERVERRAGRYLASRYLGGKRSAA